jgi:hypothetical protein
VAADETWTEVARASREALALLGYSISPRCLPDEPEACGGTWAQHAIAHFATIRAIADHQLAHGDPAGMMAWEIYTHAQEELSEGCLNSHPAGSGLE